MDAQSQCVSASLAVEQDSGRRGGVARARAEKERRKRKLGGASAPKEGATAASVRSGVAMGRGSGTFERLLGNASARQLQVSSLARTGQMLPP